MNEHYLRRVVVGDSSKQSPQLIASSPVKHAFAISDRLVHVAVSIRSLRDCVDRPARK